MIAIEPVFENQEIIVGTKNSLKDAVLNHSKNFLSYVYRCENEAAMITFKQGGFTCIFEGRINKTRFLKIETGIFSFNPETNTLTISPDQISQRYREILKELFTWDVTVNFT